MMAAFCLGSQLAQRAQADKPELGETLPLWTIYGSSLSLSRSSHRISLAVVSVFFRFAGSNPAHGMCFRCALAWVKAGLLKAAQSQPLLFSFFFLFLASHRTTPTTSAPHPPPPPPLHLHTTGQTWALRISTLRGAALIINNNPIGFKYDQ